jgi:hypothetical protein
MPNRALRRAAEPFMGIEKALNGFFICELR